jgi:GNAT superfamily N-acetyltransferase
VAEVDGAVAGYAAIAACSLERQRVPARARPQPNPPDSFPAILLGGLYVGADFRRRGVARELISVVIGIAMKVRNAAACLFVIADAEPDAVGLYEGEGFVRFREPKDGTLPLYALVLRDLPPAAPAVHKR